MKLRLSIEERVVAEAREVAALRGTTLDRLVGDYLLRLPNWMRCGLTQRTDPQDPGPAKNFTSGREAVGAHVVASPGGPAL